MKKKERQRSKPQPSINSHSFFLDARFHLTVIFGSALLLYLPTLFYQLSYYDDATLIENINQFILRKQNITQIFSQSVFGSSEGGADYYYRPMLNLSLYVNAVISGTSLAGFHFANIIIHGSAASLLYLFLIKLEFKRNVSFAASLLFTVHPVLVQAIAWIPGRNDSLLTAFALASLIFFIQYLETRKWISLAFHLLFFFLSLLTKENAILLPVLFFFCGKIITGKKIAREVALRKEFSWIIVIISWGFLAGLFFILRSQVLGSSVGLPLNFTIENFFKNLPALVQYTGKMLLPFNLSTFPILQDTSFVYGILSCVLVIYFLIRSKNIRRNYLLLGNSWLILFLIPAIIRTSSDHESVFLEHRIYFPLIGFTLLWLETDLVKKLLVNNRVSWMATATIFILFIVLSLNHSHHFKNELSYWSYAVSTSPHASFAHRGLGTSMMTLGKSSDAEKEYLQALELNPELKEVRNNLGRIYLNQGQNDKAEQKFNEEIMINPGNAVAHYNLALLRLNEKKLVDAESMMRKSLQIDPDYLDAQNDLCVILATEKKYDEAVQLCIHILESNPSYESARKNLSLIFSTWQDEEKINYYKEILKQKGLY